MSGPLAGVRVIDLGINVLAPIATQVLGDMGADVIKVETPEGDAQRRTGAGRNPGMAPAILLLNRNKRSIVLDLKRKPALEALLRLADGADVFVHAMRAQAAERLGIGYGALSTRNPRVVYAWGGGYRKDGPKKDLPAYDDVVQGESGLAALMGQVLGEPRFPPLVLADLFCGYQLASAIGLALYARERSGRGQEVQIPMFETMVSFVMHQHQWGRVFDPPVGGMGYARVVSPQRRPYRAKDGYLTVLAVPDAQWVRLFAALDRASLATDPRFATIDARTANIDELYSIVGRRIAEESLAYWKEKFDEADVPNGRINSLEELYADPYLNQTEFWKSYEHPSEGRCVTTGITTFFSETPGEVRRPPPRQGEHTEEILREAGFSAPEIAAIRG